MVHFELRYHLLGFRRVVFRTGSGQRRFAQFLELGLIAPQNLTAGTKVNLGDLFIGLFENLSRRPPAVGAR